MRARLVQFGSQCGQEAFLIHQLQNLRLGQPVVHVRPLLQELPQHLAALMLLCNGVRKQHIHQLFFDIPSCDGEDGAEIDCRVPATALVLDSFGGCEGRDAARIARNGRQVGHEPC